MDRSKRQRSVYPTPKQKKKLIELMTKHPELIRGRITQDFNQSDSQRLWHSIASECNSIPGARKSWRQWKKTWQDLRSKTKKRHADTNGALPNSIVTLTPAEQEALGLKNVSSTTNHTTEFIPLNEHTDQDNFDNVNESTASYSEADADSGPDEKVFSEPPQVTTKHKNNTEQSNRHSDNCAFNCDMLAELEQQKIKIKEDYLNFKKDYLRQKLALMKEQTEALKTIATELCLNK